MSPVEQLAQLQRLRQRDREQYVTAVDPSPTIVVRILPSRQRNGLSKLIAVRLAHGLPVSEGVLARTRVSL